MRRRLRPVRRDDRRHDDRGSAAAELIVMITAAFTFVAVIVFVGRMNVGSAQTEAAARAAARTISLARDPASAEGEAREQARRIVEEGSPICTDMQFEARIGTAEVEVLVACTVDLSQLTKIALVPGTRVVRADATESIDPYREAT